ncbi:hypothetical protein GOBAR_DD33128 [Gossypium barbadense]|nr:hypothetical protein GOBAR_DD33128 [Gossypium barbadense]
MRALSHMDSLMCSSVLDPEMWIIQGTLAWRTSPSKGTTTALLFSIIHTSLISVWTTISRAQGDGGIVPFELFFHAFSGGPEKAAINKIFLILPSRKEEREILFPFHRD